MNIRTLVQGRDPKVWAELEQLLVGQSCLPGPRANLELASAFADACAAAGPEPALVAQLEQWAALGPDQTPTESAREFLPFCALQGLGAVYCDMEPVARERLSRFLQASARDNRWRVREAVAIAVQRVAERDVDAAAALLTAWSATADLLQWRAIMAGLAHPPILADESTARYALSMADRVLGVVTSLGDAARKDEGYRVLRQGLEYAISVFVASLPAEGFALLAKWAASGHPEIRRILRANLKKNRLAGPHAERVEQVMAIGK